MAAGNKLAIAARGDADRSAAAAQLRTPYRHRLQGFSACRTRLSAQPAGTEPQCQPPERGEQGVPPPVTLSSQRVVVVRRAVQLDGDHGGLVGQIQIYGTAADVHSKLTTQVGEIRTGEHVQVTPDLQLTGTADVEHTDEVQQGSPPRQPWQGRRLGAQPGRRGAAGLDGADHGFPPQGRQQYRPALHRTALEHRGDQVVSAERQRRFWPEAGAPVDDESPAAAQLSVTADGDMNRPGLGGISRQNCSPVTKDKAAQFPAYLKAAAHRTHGSVNLVVRT